MLGRDLLDQFLKEKIKNSMFKNHKGVGDTVEAITSATGIKSIVEAGARAFNKPCGCQQRKKSLNDLFPYGKK